MSQKAIFYSLALTSLLAFALHAESAQEGNPKDNIEHRTEEAPCGDGPRPVRLALRHIEANGIGYKEGYTTLEAFYTPTYMSKFRHDYEWMPFGDVRVHIFNNGQPAVNVGVGLRYLASHLVWGANLYYDYRKTSNNHYNQLALGFEGLGRIWDFRVNGYLPVGDTSWHKNKNYFEGNSLYISKKKEFALKGFNAEAGIHISEFKNQRIHNTFKNTPFYIAAGPYYLAGHGKSSWGAQARFTLDIFEYLRLEGNASYDNIYHGIGQGQISVIIPLGKKKSIFARKKESCGRALALAERSAQRVDRFEIIPIKKKHKKGPAIDPLTGQPYTFWFVDNTSHSAGTFESPFSTLAAAEAASGPNDVIYIFPGDGTSTGMDQGITLQDNQKLYGASVQHTLPTTQGNVTISPMATELPLITNNSGDVITFVNNNEISGLYILNANGNGITQLPETITGFNVNQNTIQGYGSTFGISLNTALGNVSISDNLITSQSALINVNGLTVANASYSITDNVLVNVSSTWAQVAFSELDNSSILFSGNQINALYGVSITLNDTIANATNSLLFTGNVIYGGYAPINIGLFNNASSSIAFNDNTLVTANADGIEIDLEDQSQAMIDITNNYITTWDLGIDMTFNSPLQSTLNIANNTIIAADYYAVGLYVDGALSVTCNGNQLQSYLEEDVFYIYTTSDSNLSIEIDGNTFTGGANSINAGFNDASQYNISVTNNRFIAPILSGILITSYDSSQGVGDFSGNTFTAFVENGIQINTYDSSTGCFQVVSNSSMPYLQAYQFNQADSSTFNLQPLISNIGEVNTTGTINNVPSGGCP